MLQPVGPLPPSVYWRRRALIAVAGLLVLVLGWIALPGGGDDGGRRQTAAAAGSGTTTPTPAGDPTSLAATPPAGDPGRAGDGAGDGDGASATTPAPTTAAPPPTTTAARTTPPAPGPCPDGALALRVVPERPAYRVGQSPVLDLQVRNRSAAACVRDLGAAQQEILLYRGTQRLWSSNDCYSEAGRRPQLLPAGATESSSVTWSGLGSRPTCAGVRTRVGPGRYTLIGKLGSLVSPPTPITLS